MDRNNKISDRNINELLLLSGENYMNDINKFIEENAVNESFLSDWYQASVMDDPPVWTDEHITEVCEDFYLIPKEVIEKLKA